MVINLLLKQLNPALTHRLMLLQHLLILHLFLLFTLGLLNFLTLLISYIFLGALLCFVNFFFLKLLQIFLTAFLMLEFATQQLFDVLFPLISVLKFSLENIEPVPLSFILLVLFAIFVIPVTGAH